MHLPSESRKERQRRPPYEECLLPNVADGLEALELAGHVADNLDDAGRRWGARGAGGTKAHHHLDVRHHSHGLGWREVPKARPPRSLAAWPPAARWGGGR